VFFIHVDIGDEEVPIQRQASRSMSRHLKSHHQNCCAVDDEGPLLSRYESQILLCIRHGAV
jgi:hypothetical protein